MTDSESEEECADFYIDENQLDVSRFAVGTEAHALAQVVAQEVESKRQRDMEVYGAATAGLNALQRIGFTDPRARHWSEYLARTDVLDRCAEAIGKDDIELLDGIIETLHPANWQVFFWMRACYQELAQRVNAQTERDRLKAFLEFVAQEQRNRAAAGGVAKQRKLAGAREFVISEWLANKAHYPKGKSDFARAYSRRVMNELDIQVTERTIAVSWLKGL